MKIITQFFRKEKQKKILSWIKRKILRWAVLSLQVFLPYLLYKFVQKIYRRTFKVIDHVEWKKNFLLLEDSFPNSNLYENRRLIGRQGTSTYIDNMRKLRDSFPEHPRLRFGWGNFQPGGSSSVFTFPSLIKEKAVYVSVEEPLIGFSMFDNTSTQNDGYFRVALNNTAVFQEDCFLLPKRPSDARFRKILKKTKTKLEPYRKDGQHIIYVLQVPHDTALSGLDIFLAAHHNLIDLRRYTSRPIIVTGSPALSRIPWIAARVRDETALKYRCLKLLCKNMGINFYEDFKETDQGSSMFLDNCWCVVSHSSRFGIDALLAGKPVITLQRNSFIYPICSHDLSEIENPKMPDRIPWFSRLAYCQWTFDEIRNGTVWRHFQPSVERLLKKG